MWCGGSDGLNLISMITTTSTWSLGTPQLKIFEVLINILLNTCCFIIAMIQSCRVFSHVVSLRTQNCYLLFVISIFFANKHADNIIGIDHDTVCAGVVSTAIRNSTSCAGRRAAACGRAGRHNECCYGLQYQPRQCRPYKWSISILPRSQFTEKSKGNLRFRRLVPLFVPIGVCVTTHDDGTASDVTIGMWRHNQQVTNHERNGKPWFSLPK